MGGVFLSNTIFLTFPCLLLSVIFKFSLSNYLLLSSVVILKGKITYQSYETYCNSVRLIRLRSPSPCRTCSGWGCSWSG
jgi:hypothetical protein